MAANEAATAPMGTAEYEKGYSNGTGSAGRPASKRSPLKFLVVLLRYLTFGSTLAAFIVMITDKQSTSVFPLPVKFWAKYHYSDAFIWFVVANGVAFAYALVTAILTMFVHSTGLLRVLLLLDLIVAYILMSGASAATAVAYIGENGLKQSFWSPICGRFSRYCHHVAGALIASFLGWLFLTLAIILSLHTRR